MEVLLQTPDGMRAGRRIFVQGETVHAPHLLDVEVAQVLRRCVRLSEISPQRGAEALEDLAGLPITRYPHFLFLPRIWELRHTLTAYDAAYLALAEALGATLLTRDRALKSAGSLARVELV